MLNYLHISNLGLIEDVTLDFADGINALTGETGAGKSFIIKSLNFVLGDKFNSDIVRPDSEKATVEAIFTVDGEDLIIRRELVKSTGRSRFYLNDKLCSHESLKDLRVKLISHTSQHAQQQLLNISFQANMLEKEIMNQELLTKRSELLEYLTDLEKKLKVLLQKQQDFQSKRELYEMQKNEIDKVNPEEGEEEQLELARTQIKKRSNMRLMYQKATDILYGENDNGLLKQLADFEQTLVNLEQIDSHFGEDARAVSEFRQTLSQIRNNLHPPKESRKEHDLEGIEERLFAFAQLKRKLKRSFNQILKLKDEIKENLSFLDQCALDISRLNREREKVKTELSELLGELIPIRREAAKRFTENLEKELRHLGFSEHIRVIPEFSEYEIFPGIMDEKGKIFWAPNPGQNPQPLDRIASGGELSRFMLALNTIKHGGNISTYIFDEIDTGIGGATLNRVGEKLKDLAAEHQIILITHWPQLAAIADKHFQISKSFHDNNTFTTCEALDEEGVKRELGRMSGEE